MSKTEIINEEPNIPETRPQTEEDKFFGKTTEISNTIPEDLEVEVVDDIEVVNDTPVVDQRIRRSHKTLTNLNVRKPKATSYG